MIQLFATDDTPVCGLRLEPEPRLSMWYRGNISSRYSSNLEADASELS